MNEVDMHTGAVFKLVILARTDTNIPCGVTGHVNVKMLTKPRFQYAQKGPIDHH